MNFPVRVKIEKKPVEFDKENPHLTYYVIGVRRSDGKAVSSVFTVDENKWMIYAATDPCADRERLLMDMFSERLEKLWNTEVKDDHIGRIILPE